MGIRKKFILIVKVREIKVVVYISITFVSLFLKKGCVVYEKFMWTIFKSIN